jgi:hypothetical protein
MLSIKVSNAQDRTSRPGSAFGALETLVAAVLIAYVFPTDEKEKAASARARDQLTRVAAKGSQTLGLTFVIGLGVSLFDTLNIVTEARSKRRL